MSPRCSCRSVAAPLFLTLLYVSLLLAGAGIFWALESETEQEHAQPISQTKWDELRNRSGMEPPQLEAFIKDIIEAYKTGINLQQNATSVLGKWKFAGSFFFCVTVVTTIGYGNLSPSTTGGQIFCIFYALVGIPLNLILLNRIGQWMSSWVHRCSSVLGKRLSRPRMAKALTGSCALGLGLLLFFLLPPILFNSIEDWSYSEGIYYAFITLSTIGFGDYVIGINPDQYYPPWYKNVVALWILFGMAWLALLIDLCIRFLKDCDDICQCCGIRTRKETEELSDSSQDSNLQPVLQEPTEKVEMSSNSEDVKPEIDD
ncbi:potassium channel subfamily K member 17 [Microcaecilia unicolor]|uniref:Potassium channel subfamily K member n=1 Tax=Microcaecilia unicolor TaxID=1415580 RepID=A0A6P7XRJ3_9AMPH|nr:potassium channel subfamily K member 17 [Microcaecilia unicolor]